MVELFVALKESVPTKALGVKDMGSRSPSSLDISVQFFAALTSYLLRYH